MIDAALRAHVTERAQQRCEYCRLPKGLSIQPAFHVDHIIPKQHGGSDDPDNLALACHNCNLYKGPNLTGIDRATGELTPLFNPRTNSWHQHFLIHRLSVSGRTPIGRTTVRVLAMNTLDRLRLRGKLRAVGLRWP